MKKSIEKLVSTLQQNADGTLTGGFINIRGGKTSLVITNSPYCANDSSCSGTNSGSACGNSGTCTGANTATKCTNTGVCS